MKIQLKDGVITGSELTSLIAKGFFTLFSLLSVPITLLVTIFSALNPDPIQGTGQITIFEALTTPLLMLVIIVCNAFFLAVFITAGCHIWEFITKNLGKKNPEQESTLSD
jgi:hypothetical protein